MSKEVKEMVPELRFAEFANQSEWEHRKLAEFIDERIEVADETLPLYSLTIEEGITPKTKRYERSFLVKDKSDAYKAALPHDFAFNPMNLRFGAIAKHKGTQKIALSKYYNIFYCDQSVNSDFCEYYFSSHQMISYYNDVATGSLIEKRRVHFTDFLNFNIPFPAPKEQQKIADCLSSLDALIAAETKKLDLLREHKKGLLQQMFPAAGETVPQLRFEGFEGEWRVVPFHKVYEFKTTNSFSRDKLNYEEGTVSNIHYGDIHTKFSTLFDAEKEDIPFINPDIQIDNIKAENYLVEGDLVFADASEDQEDIGKSIEIINLDNQWVLAGLHTLLARQLKSEIVKGFGAYLFQSNWIRSQIKREAQGAKVLGISKSRLANIEIYYPKDTKEQQKIADCLSSADQSIKAQQSRIDTLKTHKKGLLQQLFPSIH